MADGDDAAAAGLAVVAGTADVRLAYNEINKSRDYTARHSTTGTHDASAIISGVLAVARIPDHDAAKITTGTLGVARIPNLPGSKITSSIDISAGGAATGQIRAYDTIASNNVYGGSTYYNTISSSYASVYVNSASGIYGVVPSSRRFKQDIVDAPTGHRGLLAARLVNFRYIEAVEQLGEQAAIEVGFIAEELDELGLTEFVVYDQDGNPFSVDDRRITFELVRIVQDFDTRLSALEKGRN